MADIPVLRGWADETANIPQAIQGVVSAFNPKFPLQLQLMQHVTDPSTLQAYADLEAENPGITQHIFGSGQATNVIQSTAQSAKGQTEQASRQVLANDPQARTEAAAAATNTLTPIQRGIQSTQAAQGVQNLATGAIAQKGAQQELQSKGIELAETQRGNQVLNDNPNLNYEAFKNLPSSDQNAVLATPLGKSLMEKQIIAEQRALQLRDTWAMRESMSAEARASMQAQSQSARQDLFVTKTFMDLQGQGLKGATIKDVNNYLYNGGDQLVKQALANPQLAQTVAQGNPLYMTPTGQLSPTQVPGGQPVDIKPFLAISNALGNTGGAKIAQNLQPQIDAQRKNISAALEPPKSMGKNSVQPTFDPNAVAPMAHSLQDLLNKQADLTGAPHKIVMVDRVGGKGAIREVTSTGDPNIDSFATALPADRNKGLQLLKSQDPAKYQQYVAALSKAGVLTSTP